jgi:hypothetical protein
MKRRWQCGDLRGAFCALVTFLLVVGCGPTPLGSSQRLQYGMQVEPGNDLDRAMTMLTGAGFGWAKVQVRWEAIEREPGNVNWQVVEEAVAATQRHNVKLLASVVTAPRWARPANTDFSVPGPPADPNELAAFLGEMAKRYEGKVHATGARTSRTCGTSGRAGRLNVSSMSIRLAQKIKAADRAIIVSGAPTPTGVTMAIRPTTMSTIFG